MAALMPDEKLLIFLDKCLLRQNASGYHPGPVADKALLK